MNTAFVLTGIVLAVGTVLFGLYVLQALKQKNLKPATSDDAKRELEEERDAALGSIKALEAELKNNHISNKNYETLRKNDEHRAAVAIGQLEKLKDTKNFSGQPALWPLAVLCGIVLGFGIFIAPQLQRFALNPSQQKEFDAAAKLEAFESKHDGIEKFKDKEILEYAEIAWGLKDYQRVLLAYGAILKRDPRNALALRRYGMALFFSGEVEQAEQLLRLSLQLEPNTDAYMTLGNLLFSSRNDPAGAIVAWQQYQKLGGNSPRIKDLIQAANQRLGTVELGAKSFATNCAGCHGSNGQGIVGPKLTDNKNAASVDFVTTRLKTGKGSMPAFPQIAGAELQKLLSHVNAMGKKK